MKLKTKTNTEDKDDWNFDFTIYEDEETKNQQLNTLKQKKPQITGLKSKYSPSSLEIENITQIKVKISEYAIKTASRTQNIQDLWKLYASINEYWSKIHDIFGTIIINEIKTIDKACLKLLQHSEQKDTIHPKTYTYLLYYRDKIYMISQRANLGLEVEKISHTYHQTAKNNLTQ